MAVNDAEEYKTQGNEITPRRGQRRGGEGGGGKPKKNG